jgi:hypothetical protein
MNTFLKINTYLIVLNFLFSCQKEKENCEMNLYKSEIYLKDSTGEGLLPPLVFLKFKLKNNTNEYKFFATKQNRFDKDGFSRFMLIDTLSKKMIYIYSGDIQTIKPKETIKIGGEIDIREFKDYFGLEETFFNKLDYSDDKSLFIDKVNKMLQNSIIIYNQDEEDIKTFLKMNFEKIPYTTMGNDLIIKVKKGNVKAEIYKREKINPLEIIEIPSLNKAY